MEEKKLSPLKAIRQHCLWCCGTANEVKLCPCTDCNLYPYRFGKGTRAGRELTEEQRQANAERLRKWREEHK